MIRQSDLKGFVIPGYDETLKATLYADDTTVYLTEEDDFSILQGIMDKWCIASKAKFNIGKTEIIPIGNKQYRIEMINEFKGGRTWKNYPPSARIADEGEVERILGAWFGNGVDECIAWAPTIEKIIRAFKRWSLGHNSMEARRHAAQQVAAGMTQFLTDVQQMPDSVLKRLLALTRNFIWAGKTVGPVAMEHLYAPIEQGGIKLVDLDARNEAINTMWLKEYLNFGGERPLWAYLRAGPQEEAAFVPMRDLRENADGGAMRIPGRVLRESRTFPGYAPEQMGPKRRTS
ncbi:hypothetical protein K523DRAFT_400107 [Schizophyllum commune Tattone D]|nr:hypothetical protein K523DRAFT_400107 [Schizophyllum commune Tattone D]